MKALLLTALLVVVSMPALARDTRHTFQYKNAMSTDEAKSKLSQGIKFFFGKQKSPSVRREIGTFVANRKTNASNKSDERACQWAFLSAMISLQQRAVREGGNAVIKIHSYYKKNTDIDSTKFECGAGTFVAGVALRGTVVVLK
jgi:uncharacterized protein YbjQ (UPF0145 family)